jgi:DNA helicase HerA-like ATPase
MSERKIGKVISVDSFRVFIKLDEDLKSLYKSGYEDIFEVARINSYLIIPIGSDKIVAMVTRVKAIDETELSKDKEAIFLTDSARYLVATMIGTIEGDKKYIQGVYNYPVLDNPVWYVTKRDLDNIFDQKEKTTIDFDKDYYLPIGSSPSFSDYKIKINPDKFFGKHAAILGNTGSGKSCTLTSIVHSLYLSFSYNDKNLKNAHIIIFDTNGEYKQAFQGNSEKGISPFKKLELVNPFHIDKKGMKVPYWFMNFDDFDYLFDPTAGTQAPILKRALGLAKSNTEIEGKPVLDSFTEKGILDLIQSSPDDIKKKKKKQNYGNWEYKADNEIIGLANAINPNDDEIIDSIKSILKTLGSNNTIDDERNAISQLEEKYQEYVNSQQVQQITVDKNIDLPVWFNFTELISSFFDQAINEQETSSNRIREFVSTLRLRLQSYVNDERIADPLLLKQKENITESLAKFLAFVLGDFCKIYQEADDDTFTNYYKENLSRENNEKLKEDEISQITIIDMSLLPYEVLETITGLVGRLILDFVSRFPEKDRGKMPIILALEEAQNYIPEKNKKDKESISKKVFERIAREGRKYGISLIVSSQRPFELSKTVLSQCNSFIIHRLQNPEDQKYVRQLVSSANEDILQQLPILPQQHAIIMGDAVRTPVQVKIRTVSPTPNSSDPKFIENWLSENEEGFPNYKPITESWQKGEKYEGENDHEKEEDE